MPLGMKGIGRVRARLEGKAVHLTHTVESKGSLPCLWVGKLPDKPLN